MATKNDTRRVRLHEAPDHRSDAAYVIALAISDWRITRNLILLLGTLGLIVCAVSATWLSWARSPRGACCSPVSAGRWR